MRILKIFLILIVMLLGGIFAMLNAEPVNFNYYFGSLPLPLSLLITLALAVGVIVGILASIGMVLGLKRKNATLKQRERLANLELRNLRNLPLQDQ